MNVGTLCYATTQGLGYLAKAFYDNGVITHPIIWRHSSPKRPTHTEWYAPNTPVVKPPYRSLLSIAAPVLDTVEVMIFFETPFDWGIIAECRQRGVKTVLIPMYEWAPEVWPEKPDAVICPSLLDYDYFKDEFSPVNCRYLPIPVDPRRWQLRTKVKRFLHNAGNVGHQEHKGTRELLEAVKYVTNPEFRLTVGAQDVRDLRKIMAETGFENGDEDPRVSFDLGEIPYTNLWDGHQVYVAPEKFNGLSLPIQEAYTAGMMVITTDRYPANTWLPKEPLIPVKETRRARVANGCKEFDESIVDPKDIAAKIEEYIAKDVSGYSIMAQYWARANSWASLKLDYLRALEEIVNV